MFFVFWLANEEDFRIRQECPMDETQPDVIPEYSDLAYPGTDRSSPLLEIVAKTPAVLALGCTWSNACYDISDLQHNIPQLSWYLLEIVLNRSFWKHHNPPAFAGVFSPEALLHYGDVSYDKKKRSA